MTYSIKLTSKRQKAGPFSIARKLFLSLIALFMAIPAFAQNIDVSGTVVDETGEPLIGVTVMVTGTSNGTATDLDGNYSLKNVPSKGKIVFSYIGYADKTENVNGRTRIDVKMSEDSQTLEELVVVGYGTIKKSDLTGSVSTVDTEKLNSKGAISAIENLQGTVPGVNITKSTGRSNGSIAIEIRGKSSINGSTTPLYVVDGVICSDIDFLNPQDIERIDVLKDASSTAIYGSRATAGVVMVTTKGGANVKKNTKANITYDGYYGWNKVSRMPEFMDGQQFYNYRFLKFTEPTNVSNPGAQPIYKISAASVGQGLLQQNNADSSSPYILKQMLENGSTYDWPGLVTKDGHQQNHYVAVSGSSESVNYHFGIGINEEDGIYAGDGKQMFNFKGSVDTRINKVISAGFNVNLAYIKNTYADDNSIAGAYRVNPFSIPYDENGNIIHFPANAATLGTNGHQFSDFVSPLEGLRNTNDKRKTYRMLGNVYLQLDIIPGLNVKTTFSPSFSYYRNGHFDGYVNPDTGLTYAGNDPNYDFSAPDADETYTFNSANVTNHNNLGWTWDNTINYSRTINGIHSINALGLFSMEKGKTEEYYFKMRNVMENTDWWNMSSGKDNKEDKSSYSESSLMSYAFRVNYALMGRYMLTATVRGDGSSKLAPGHKWATFPSVAAAWNIADESFLQKSWLNNLKLRVAYGVTGNNKGIGNYASIVGIGGPVFYPFGSGYVEGYYPNGIVDNNLGWEKSYEFNVGLDFGFLNNRLTGTIDWYHKKSKDLLYKVDLPLESGGVSMSTNVGSVKNVGVEIGLSSINIDTRDWQWTTSLMFSHNENEVLEINGVSDQILSKGITTGSLFVGSPVNNVYSFILDGIVSDRMMTVPNHEIAKKNGFNPGDKVRECDYYYACYGITEGQPMLRDVNGDGKWEDTDDRVLLNSEPKWIGSFTSNLTYNLPKNGGQLDFGFSIYTRQGGKVYSPFYTADWYDYHDRGRGKMAMDYYIPAGALIDLDGINPDGTYINPVYQTETHYGEFPFPNSGDSDGVGAHKSKYDVAKGVTDGSFWKVKNITLGYSFSKNILKYIGCQQARIYCTIANPFVWSKYKGFDPEWSTASTKTDGPSVTSYQLGVSIKF